MSVVVNQQILDILERRRGWMSVGELRAALGVDDTQPVTDALADLHAQGRVDRHQLAPQLKELWGHRGPYSPPPDRRPR